MKNNAIVKAIFATIVTLAGFVFVLWLLTLLDYAPEWARILFLVLSICYVVVWFFILFYKHYKD